MASTQMIMLSPTLAHHLSITCLPENTTRQLVSQRPQTQFDGMTGSSEPFIPLYVQSWRYYRRSMEWTIIYTPLLSHMLCDGLICDMTC